MNLSVKIDSQMAILGLKLNHSFQALKIAIIREIIYIRLR